MIDVDITVKGNISDAELNEYIKQGREKEPNKNLIGIEVIEQGDYVDIAYHYQEPNFERIRRITGYLVGTTDRFNNGKKAEEQDRVKHYDCRCCDC